MSWKSTAVLMALIAWLVASVSGCREPDRGEKAVYPITVQLLVDGQPQADVQVQLHDVAGLDTNQPTLPSGFTAADGRLTISTYAQGDGAPAGTYQVSLTWQQFNPISLRFSGPDKLNGRYSDPKKSGITWTVEAGKNDWGTIELSSR